MKLLHFIVFEPFEKCNCNEESNCGTRDSTNVCMYVILIA